MSSQLSLLPNGWEMSTGVWTVEAVLGKVKPSGGEKSELKHTQIDKYLVEPQ